MAKRSEKPETPTIPDDNEATPDMVNFTVRIPSDLRSRLAAAAEKHRKNTGARDGAATLARLFIETGLHRFERRGTIEVSN